jgi:hypothetical protein
VEEREQTREISLYELAAWPAAFPYSAVDKVGVGAACSGIAMKLNLRNAAATV